MLIGAMSFFGRAGYLTHPPAFSVRQLADIDDAGHPISEER